ncbi:hypothetical protein FRB99_002788 [Tulasnella sp. 403]|nr:hypothetical protein FRB99_002788 [Tulasnella sp. 403]
MITLISLLAILTVSKLVAASPSQLPALIKYLDRGTVGCVYDLLEGPSGAMPPAVIKTPRKNCYNKRELDTEVSALRGVGQFLFDSYDDQGERWVAMKKGEGVPLWNHPDFKTKYRRGYNRMDPGLNEERRKEAIEDCVRFMSSWYQLVINAIGEALLDSGWEYTDLNWENFLFSVGPQPKVTLIDWGGAEKIPDDQKEDRWKVLQPALWSLLSAEYSAMPLYDGDDFQGICQSNQRDDFGKIFTPVHIRIKEVQFKNGLAACSIM